MSLFEKPSVSSTRHILPYDRLDPLAFERLCLGLVVREGYERAEHLGAAGGEQGRDLRAWKDGQQVIFQCKRVKQFGPADARKEIQKLLDLPKKDRPTRLIFLITTDVSVLARDAARKLAKTKGIICEFWSLSELDEKVSGYPDLLERFFGFAPEKKGKEAPYTRWTVPFPSLGDGFIGREGDVIRVDELLQKSGRVGISGFGGLGKTQLAAETAHRYRGLYPDGVFWLNAAQPVLAALVELSHLIGLAETGGPQDHAVFALRDYLAAHSEALLIFDNLEEPESLLRPAASGVIPAELPGKLLFTTRRSKLPAGFEKHELRPLSDEEALRLLLRGRPQPLVEGSAEFEAAKESAIGLGGHPLALELAAEFLRIYSDFSLLDLKGVLDQEGILAFLEHARGEVAPENLGTRYAQSVRAMLRAHLDRLQEDADAVNLFKALGQMPEAAWVPIARLGLLCGISDRAKLPPSPLDRGIRKLVDTALLEGPSEDRVRLHPLVHEYAVGLAEQGLGQGLAGRLAEAYKDLERLEGHAAARGVDEVIEDLEVGLGLLRGQEQTDAGAGGLADLRRILDRDAHLLRGWNSQELPAYFLQTLAWRARTFSIKPLAETAENLLESREVTHLRWSWGNLRESPSLVRILAGHTGGVGAVVVTPDGRRAVSASADHTLRVWDLASGLTLQILEGHDGDLRTVALTAEGRRAVSGSADHTLRVWDLTSGLTLHVLTGHTSAVDFVALTPDGRRGVSISHNEKTLRVWDLNSGRTLRILEGHTDNLDTVALTPDGHRAVSASLDHTLRVWDLDTGQTLRLLEGHTGRVWDVALTPDGHRAVSSSEDGTLREWDLTSGQTTQVLHGHTDAVNIVVLTPDGRQAVSASFDHTLRVWDLSSGQILHVLEGHTDAVGTVALTRDGRRAVSASGDHTLRVWDLESGQTIQILEGHRYPVWIAALSPDGNRVVSASQDQTLHVWEVNRGQTVQLREGHTGWVNTIAVAAAQQRAVSASQDRTLRIWDLNSGKSERILKGHTGAVLDAAADIDGRWVVSASEDRTLRVWDLESGQTRQVLEGHTDAVGSVSLLPGGHRAISASQDWTLRVWDLDSGQTLLVLEGHRGVVKAVTVSQDGRQAVSAAGDLRVWDLDSGQTLQVLGVLPDSVLSFALSPDGSRAVSAHWDGALRVWDLVSGRILQVLEGHTGWVSAVALTPDGSRVVSASMDGTLRVWDLDSGQPLQVLKGHAGLSALALTPDGTRAVSASYYGTLQVWDMDDYQILAVFGAEGASAFALSDSLIIAGTASGSVFCLQFVPGKLNKD